MDEMVLPYFEQTERHRNPFLARRYGLDRAQFKPVLDEFYTLHGWDTERGWPTREHLIELGMEDVYEPLMDGADRRRDNGS
jgi:aldehyde:ferredoxin oxidoreductase